MLEVLEVRETQHKGRSLFTTRHVKAGEVVLNEAPLLLAATREFQDAVCACCLRLLPAPGHGRCQGCQQACFCSPACLQAAAGCPWSHSTAVCRAMAAAAALQGLDAEQHNLLRFLIHTYAMRAAAASDPEQRYQQLISLHGDADTASQQQAAALHQALCSVVGDPTGSSISLLEVAALLSKEQRNTYGIMAPPGPRGQRRVRGAGIYITCSLVNHECLPNTARFDAFDSGRPGSTCLELRALHDLPAGTEVTQSYFPLGWGFEQRQQQCQDVYGFTCCCPRCQTESQYDWANGPEGGSSGEWETDDDNDEMQEESEEEDQEQEQEHQEASAAGTLGQGQQNEVLQLEGEEGPAEPSYIQLFILKYACPRPQCYGTLAPLHNGSDVYECNVCGGKRTEAEFMQELEH